MRLSDLGDYFALRHHLERPWEFLRLRKRPPPGPFHDVALRGGGSVRLREAPMDRHIFHRIFARDEYHLNGVAPGAWDDVVDVGAHIGIFAIRAAPLARRVLCYEPDPANYALLVENTRRFSNVRPHRQALAGRGGSATLFVSGNPSAHSIHPSPEGRAGAAVSVETVSLSDVFTYNRIARCDLLKLDCEGAEYEVLFSSPPGLWERIERVAMEYHPVPGGPAEWTTEGLIRFLEGRGHEVRIHPSRRDPAKGHLFSFRKA